jgi:putative transposase
VRSAPRRSDNGDLRSRLREISGTSTLRVRAAGNHSRSRGLVMNHKKLLRLYCQENLRVRRRRGRKRAMGTRAPMTLAQGPHQRWGPRLRQRHADQQLAHPHPGGGRRLYTGMPGAGG